MADIYELDNQPCDKNVSIVGEVINSEELAGEGNNCLYSQDAQVHKSGLEVNEARQPYGHAATRHGEDKHLRGMMVMHTVRLHYHLAGLGLCEDEPLLKTRQTTIKAV